MVSQQDKAELWRTIRTDHPELARSLTAQLDYIAIDQYPAKTNDWLMRALEARRPDLARHIKDVLVPHKNEMKDLFSASITLPVEDLIPVLVEFEKAVAGRLN